MRHRTLDPDLIYLYLHCICFHYHNTL
jgi:hypothetical protein